MPIQTAIPRATTTRHARMTVTLNRKGSRIRSGLFGECQRALPRRGGGRRLARERGAVLEDRVFLTRRTYARRIRTGTVLLLALAAMTAAAGCGSSAKQTEPPAAGTTTVTAPTTTSEGIDPLEGAGTSVVVGTTTAKATALLERVAVGRHEGYDRVVFQFQGAGVPGYRVAYVEPPLKEDGSGNP